ncbi:carbohydrate ABC transporter permease [Anoxybacillus sp. J5B_2022]|uniref:carbohydrate ABC transporter permease n=1 Tax=Anoxybacillus sp. J5B_2022 TaxID=3003246 RepID=UPI0022855332|nr:carbohydrate ABC transporter permease [Anoxybacillus sp. J5B_2022]MCZ0756099.1 carbohydrate ABC transporter permease [Anoxybacillus sp. J5B_2022]
MSIFRSMVTYILLVIGAVIVMFPIGYAFIISFLSGAQLLQGVLWPDEWSLQNYVTAFEKVPLLRYLWNSFIVSFIVMIGQLLVSSLAAYAFVFLRFWGRDVLFFMTIATMLIPWEATVIPNFLTIQKFGWTNSYLGLTVPFFALAFGIFLLRQHFKTIPFELYEAAQVSGVRHFRFFWYVVLPLSKTSLATLGVYSFLTTWNMYLWPLLVTNDEKVRTVQIGLKQMQTQEMATEWGVVMAAVVIVIMPTLLLLFIGQKQLQKGLMQGAIK